MATLGPRLVNVSSVPVVRAVLHNFCHAGWFHLAANVASIWLLLPRRGRDSWRGLLLGTVAWLVCAPHMARVPVGMSDAILGLVGFRVARRGGGWWRSRWFATVAVTLLLQLMVPGVSAATHIVSLAMGMIYGTVLGAVERNERIYGKVSGDSRHSGRERT